MNRVGRSHTTRPLRFIFSLYLAVLLLWGGCAAQSTLHFADLNFKRMAADEQLLIDVRPDRCVWSIVGDQIHIALSAGNFKGESGDRLTMSIVLDGIPTGNEREYRVERRALRGYWHQGRDHERFASLNGVVSVKLLPAGILEGRFKFLARKQVFHILTNWTTVGQTMLMGTVTAHRDPESASSILVETEKGGMERKAAGNNISNGVPQPRQVVGPDVG